MNRTVTFSSPTQRVGFSKQPLVGGTQEIQAIIQAMRAGECCRFIGARYHHKSRIMREACSQVDKQLGFVSLYLSLADASATSEEAFVVSIRDLVVQKANRYYSKRYHRRLSKPQLKSYSELTLYLASAPDLYTENVAFFVDDLDLAPAENVGRLLDVLRAAYQTTTGLRFLAVVCASNSLAGTALGPTSPFENISRLVTVRDLDQEDTYELTRQLVAPFCPNPTQGALKLIHGETSGDRFLITEICRECRKVIDAETNKRITQDVVRTAIGNLVRYGGKRAISEGFHRIEADPQLLIAILQLMREGAVSVARLPFDATHPPDPLTTSGFVALERGSYRIKSHLHQMLLRHHFSSEQIGRVFLAAGDWERAIRYLGVGHDGEALEQRARVLLAALNAMYTVQSKRDAYSYLLRGLQSAYPHLKLTVYDFDKSKNALLSVELPASDVQTHTVTHVSLSAKSRPEIKALENPQEFSMQALGRYHLRLLIPVRLTVQDPVGLVIVENLVTQQNFRQRQEEIQEFIGYTRHAAGALKNRIAYERLYRQVEQRAEDLRHLLILTRQLMSAEGSFQQILDQALHSAVKALNRHAQMGSIYLFERETGLLKMRADTGYPESVRAAQFYPGEGLAGYVYQTGKPYRVRDARFDVHYKALADMTPPVLSSIGVPLIGTRGSLGMLCLDNRERTNAFDDEDEQLLMLFAGQVALWLEQVRLLETQQHSRESALLASRLLHQVSSAMSLIPELVEEVTQAAEGLESIAAPLHELYDIARAVDYIGGWLDKYVRVGNISIEPVEMPALLDAVIQRVEHECPPHVVVKRLDSVSPVCRVHGDRKLISVLVENLLLNSYDALRDCATGQVHLEVRVEGDLCVLRVSDNGPGIPAENRAKIWEPGWTTKGRVAGQYGRGLGLSLCHQIAAAHEGTLILEASSVGATFVLHLPIGGPRSLLHESPSD